MKQFLKLTMAVLMLSAVFGFGLTIGNEFFAGSLTIGIATFSAVKHFSPYFKGMAFNAFIIPDFTAKTDEEVKGMDFTALKEYREKEMAHNVAVAMKPLHDQIQEFKKEKSEANLEAIKSLEGTIETLKSEHIEWGLRMKKLEEMPKELKTVEGQVHKFIEENQDKIKEIYDAKNGMIEFKVVGDISTGSATNPVAPPELVGVNMAAPGNANLRGTIWEGLVTNIPTSSSIYAYTDTLPKEGAVAFVAEGGSKPQIDFSIETRYAEPVKVAAHQILTEESITDIPQLQAVATSFLRQKHDLKKQNGIFFGDGISPNPKGATVYGRTFVAGSMALAVPTPNFMDVVNACITDIYTTHNYTDEMPYIPNLVMVNPVTFYLQLVSAKDLNGLPLYPQAGLFNRVQIGGVTIIPFEDIPVANIFVADMSKYNVTNYVSYSVRIGWINDQFITNKFTMVGESRFHAFVKNLDEQAFIYDAYATIKTAIATI